MKEDYIIYTRPQGKSMHPQFQSSTELLLEINKNANFKTGEIVCFLQKHGLIVHRIISKSSSNGKQYFLLKGDNNIHSDGIYNKSDIFGKVIYIIDNEYIIFYKKGIKINNFVAKISKISQKSSFHFKALTPLRFVCFYLLAMSNIDTGLSELKQIIYALKTGEVNKISKEIDMTLLDFLSLKNKFLGFSYHDREIDMRQKFFTEVLNLEKERIFEIFQNKNIEFVSLDNISKYSTISGSDVDVLINYKQLPNIVRILSKNNFSVKNRYEQEISFLNNVNHIQLDLHFLINHPRSFYFDKKRSIKFTKEFFKILSSKKHSQRFRNEYFFLGKVICYWTNDFLRGLNTLNSLGDFIKTNNINWKDFEYIANKHNFLGEAQLALSISKNLFQQKSLNEYCNTLNIKIKILSHYYNYKKVGIFGSTTIWGIDDDENTRKIYIECFIASLISNKHTPFLRLLRPRIILFFSIALIRFYSSIFTKYKTNLIYNFFN